MTTPKDYEVQVRVKNNWLLTAMRRKGCETAADLSRLTGVNQGTIGDLLNLSTTFMLQNGEWKKSVLMISAALCCLPEELAPPQHIEDPLEKTTRRLRRRLTRSPTSLITAANITRSN